MRFPSCPISAKNILLALAFLVLPAIFSSVAGAQSETGQVFGAVNDPSGAPIAGVEVAIKSLDTGVQRQTSTDANGKFVFAGLFPADYEIAVEAVGFAPLKRRVRVYVGSRTPAELDLAIGEFKDVVVVQGKIISGVQAISDIVTTDQISELPTIARTPYELVALSGNISSAAAKSIVSSDAILSVPTGRGVGFSINGQRASSANIMLDGSDNSNSFSSGVGQQVPLDSLQEFSVITNNFSAEYGRASGGVINVATKSGTNGYHGSLYEFNRVSRLASNTFDNNAQDIDKGVFTRNQFGYSIGGPVVKNKIFFFNNGEFLRVRSAQDTIFFVPIPASQVLTGNTNTRAFFNEFDLRVPVSKNPADRLTLGELGDIFTSSIFDVVGLPNNTEIFAKTRVPINTDVGGGPPQNTYQFVSRLDWNLGGKASFYARHAIESINQFRGTISAGPYRLVSDPGLNFDTGSEAFNNNGLLSFNYLFSPRFTSNSKLVFNRLNIEQPIGENGQPPLGPTLYAVPNRALRINGLPVAFPGYLPLEPGRPIPFFGPQNVFQFFEDLNFSAGNHEFRFGGALIYIQDNRTSALFGNAVEILGANIGDAVSNLLTGQLFSFTAAIDPQTQSLPGSALAGEITKPNFSRTNRYRDLSFYGQDTWKIYPRVTFNYGVRYDYFGVQHSNNPERDSNFYLGVGSSIFERIRNGKVRTAKSIGKLYNGNIGNFAPRLGLAWDVFGKGKTILRGGYGISYERNFNNALFNVIQNPPNFAVVTFAGNQRAPITLNNNGTVGNVLPALSASSGVNLRAIDQDLDTAYAHFFSVSMQQTLLNDFTLSIDYSGSLGRNLYSADNLNRRGSGKAFLGDASMTSRLNNTYADIIVLGNRGKSNYNGLTIGVEGRNLAKSGLTLTAKYTYSHAIDNISSTLSESDNNINFGLLDPFNPNLDRGNADFDTKHRFITSGVWNIPFANKTRGLKNRLLDGWEVNYLFAANTGLPFSIYDCRNTVGSLGSFTCPRISLSSPLKPSALLSGTPNFFEFINLRDQQSNPVFVNPITGTSELPPFDSRMTGRNVFRSPGRWSLDASFAKRVIISERYSLQFRAEFFNIFNHANLAVLGSQADISASNFVPAKRDGRRQVQLALKFIF